MRTISFALTTQQIRNRVKTVTRRTGWADLKPGTLLRAVVKGMGLRKGERTEALAVICVEQVSREPLHHIEAWGKRECIREGFPDMKPKDFVRMFCEHNGCDRYTVITRIEFRYVPGGRLE